LARVNEEVLCEHMSVDLQFVFDGRVFWVEVDGPMHFLDSDVAREQEASQRALVFDEANPGAYAAAVQANAAQQFMTGATALKVRQLEMLKVRRLVAPSACPHDPPDPIVLHVPWWAWPFWASPQSRASCAKALLRAAVDGDVEFLPQTWYVLFLFVFLCVCVFCFFY
jgi:hypothetical protein